MVSSTLGKLHHPITICSWVNEAMNAHEDMVRVDEAHRYPVNDIASDITPRTTPLDLGLVYVGIEAE